MASQRIEELERDRMDGLADRVEVERKARAAASELAGAEADVDQLTLRLQEAARETEGERAKALELKRYQHNVS
jgi:hypothetical protein